MNGVLAFTVAIPISEPDTAKALKLTKEAPSKTVPISVEPVASVRRAKPAKGPLVAGEPTG